MCLQGSLQHIDVLWEAAQSLVDAAPSLYIGVHDRQVSGPTGPVAGMCLQGSLQHIDVLWEAAQSLVDAAPSLYIGVHDRQLYIQESVFYAQKLETSVSAKPVPWKLKHSRPLLDGQETALSVQDPEPNTLSLITLYGTTEPTGNHGFFLYLQETCDQAVQVSEESIDGPDIVLPTPDEDHEHHHIHVHVYSLWFWWKEVLLIAVSSALLMNLMIWPRFFAPKLRPSTPLPVNHQENIIVERYYERPPPTPPTQEYSGRYENDFTPLRCLGRGGFGVVFEARNNIDHCSYAVKRITLPKRESKRERVLREVRALAKLEHENIVRYFNAWLEEPPPLWQEQRDAVWMRELDGVSVAMTDECTATSPPNKSSHTKRDSVRLELQKSIDDCVDALDYEKRLADLPKRNRSLSCNDSFSIVFEDNVSKHSQNSHHSSRNSHHSSHNSTHHSTPTSPKHSSHDFNISTTPDLSKNLGDYATTDLSKNITSGDFGVKNVPQIASGDNDDSFIVFAHSENPKSGQSEARKESSVDKRLERVKEIDGFTKTDSTSSKNKKKGHRRHWSLDLCVRTEPAASKMYLYIQMQLCLRDSLHDWLRLNRTPASRGDKVKVLFSQIVSAVEYVHLAGLIHRDLKPSNIFFAPDGRVKVGDFGLVTAMNDSSQDGGPTDEIDAYARHTYRVGTHLYMSPEQLLCRPYSYKVDIYSLGLILFELLQPFGTESERVTCLLRLRDARYPHRFNEEYPQESEVLKLMLSEDPSQRPTAMGVKARAPLYQRTDERYHFTLPNAPA
ncbi:eukaryotic translation initiation factor 2-alpha kinase-like isoform X2 [Ostrinia furnacalis]|uniref:eukaryotic translation initiation factor 2-alpha kinase-like isoform X2 n=1 Tax=Ostrinia furnacalis TaxID=93504 RepID=UPI00103D87D9|nr:eukaryotic translation initiation factor 2-alpha kinase-like isoform X2 [Ostrinia furnacalis]